MDIRLNKLLSDAGVCSRREADEFIETDRVAVDGKLPMMGQRVAADDVVLVDGEKINVEKYLRQQEEMRQDEAEERELIRSLRSHKEVGEKKQAPKKEGERYGKFNKFAAARKAAKEGRPWNEKMTDRRKLTAEEDRLLREALRKQDGKPLRKAALAQRIAANPKSAALRKTSRNNPINKARRAAKYNSRNDD